jgi:hypothetical protein
MGKTVEAQGPVDVLVRQPEPAAWMNPNESFVRDAVIWNKDDRHPEYNVPLYALPDGWEVLPGNFRTHIADWDHATNIAWAYAAEEDKAYWVHQMRVIKSIRDALGA